MTTMENLKILNKKVLIVCKNNFRYSGIAVHEDEIWIHLDDDRTKNLILIAKDQILSLEIRGGIA